jgi:hypothetical protein
LHLWATKIVVPSASSVGSRISFDYFGLYSTILAFFASIYVSFISIYLTLLSFVQMIDRSSGGGLLFDWCVVASCGVEPEEQCTEQPVGTIAAAKGKEKWRWWWIARIRPSGLAIFCFHS